MLHATNDQAPARPQHKKRDADAFAADIRARQASPQANHALNGPTHATDPSIRLRPAQLAAERLATGQTRSDWFAVGYALQDGQNEAMREAHVNKPEGKGYAIAISAWLKRVGLDKVAHDRTMRSHLLKLIENINAVEKWLELLPPSKRLTLNHPTAIWRNWKKSTVVPNPETLPKISPIAAIKQSLIDSQEEVARLKEANGGNLFTPKTSAKDVVRILRETFSTSKFNEIRRILNSEGVQ